MRIRITAKMYFPNGSLLGIYTDECEYYHYYSDTFAYHSISLPNGQVFTESYPKGDYRERSIRFIKCFSYAQAYMLVQCGMRNGLSELDVKFFKGPTRFEMAPVTHQFLVYERRDDGRIIKGSFEIVEDQGYIATVFIYPDNPDWAVPAANKKFGIRKDANNYVLNNIINHDWFDYYNPLEQSGGKS